MACFAHICHRRRRLRDLAAIYARDLREAADGGARQRVVSECVRESATRWRDVWAARERICLRLW